MENGTLVAKIREIAMSHRTDMEDARILLLAALALEGKPPEAGAQERERNAPHIITVACGCGGEIASYDTRSHEEACPKCGVATGRLSVPLEWVAAMGNAREEAAKLAEDLYRGDRTYEHIGRRIASKIRALAPASEEAAEQGS